MRLSELVGDESIRKLVVDCKNEGFEIKLERFVGERLSYSSTRGIKSYTANESIISGRYIISLNTPRLPDGSLFHPYCQFRITADNDGYEVQFFIIDGYSSRDTAERILSFEPEFRWHDRHLLPYLEGDDDDEILSQYVSPSRISFFEGIDDDDEIRSAIEKIKMLVIMNIGLFNNRHTGADLTRGPSSYLIKK